jgi:shikimate 5-dehydrogenase
MINKDTVICCSFAGQAGNFGCNFFNTRFQELNMNWIYKSFSVTNIAKGMKAMRTLGFRGAGISMPFKQKVIKHLNYVDDFANAVQSVNTVVNKKGKLSGYNTDRIAIERMLLDKSDIVILGTGCYARTAQFVCCKLKKRFCVIGRSNWDSIALLRDKTIFNCTPAENVSFHESCEFIDSNVNTETGRLLATYQAEEQWKLYTEGVND